MKKYEYVVKSFSSIYRDGYGRIEKFEDIVDSFQDSLNEAGESGFRLVGATSIFKPVTEATPGFPSIEHTVILERVIEASDDEM